MFSDKEAFLELSYYTLAHHDPAFIHQYAVDAYAAQHADEHSKPIYLAFALAGLYLHNEKHFTGGQVQLAHMQLAKRKDRLQTFSRPAERGSITVQVVLAASPGTERDQVIERWSASVWEAYRGSHHEVGRWIRTELNIDISRKSSFER
jgi:Family of unknown function (DUF5946)